MKHPIYKTKRFWKLVEKEFKTNKNNSGNLFLYLCHGSPTFKAQWQLADFREFCRLHGQTVLGGQVLVQDTMEEQSAFCVGEREPRLCFLAHMINTISLRSRKSL